jgi:predicted nucleic acid-binding protein
MNIVVDTNIVFSAILNTQSAIYKNIEFINEALIRKHHRLKAYNLLKEVDLNDIVFLALNEHLKAILWSGDKILIRGLRNQRYHNIITTDEIKKLRDYLKHPSF